MPHAAPWPLVHETLAFDGSIFRVLQDCARSPRTGREHEFLRIEARDWVNVVPVTRSGDIVLLRQYRHGSRTVTWEIPGGQIDPGETPAEAAGRELREETGYGGGTLRPIGVVNPNPALFANACHTFLADGVEVVGPIANEGAEETEAVVVSRAELEELVATGAIDHALVIAALYWFDRAEGP